MRRLIIVMGVFLTGCVTPPLQSTLLQNKKPDMEAINQACAQLSAGVKNQNTAEINCRFDRYEVLLGEAGFEQFNAFDKLKAGYLSAAKKLDAKKITEQQATDLFKDADATFASDIKIRDNAKIHYSQAIEAETTAAILGGLSSGLQSYSRAYSGAPVAGAYSCPACQQGIQQQQAYRQQDQIDELQQKIQQQDRQMQEQQAAAQRERNRLNSMSPAERVWGPSYIGP